MSNEYLEDVTRLTIADLDVKYIEKKFLMPPEDATELRDRVVSAHIDDFDGIKDVIETIATEIAEDEENISEEAWKGALRFKQELIEVFDLE